MRSRLPILLIALTILFALVAAGCGDDMSTTDSGATAGATQSTEKNPAVDTSSVDSSLDACIEGAEALPDTDNAAAAKKRCQDAYKNVKDSSAKIDKAAKEARAKCEEAASKIPDAQAKSNALAACAKFN